jgi:hypothetical protein
VDQDEASTARLWGIACAILRYLQASPDAKDTLEGIAQWWLWLEVTEPALADVKRALALLVSEGIILETRRDGIPLYYRLNPAKRKDISRILDGS